jgi:hypothetical protein
VAGACVGVTLNGVLSVRRRRGGELDREGAGWGHTIGGRAPAHSAYSARRVHGRLCSGLGACFWLRQLDQQSVLCEGIIAKWLAPEPTSAVMGGNSAGGSG